MKSLPKPLRDDVLVKYHKPEEKTHGGLFIPERAQRVTKDFTLGTVIELGPACYGLELNSVVLVEGHRSGFAIDDYFVVSSKFIYGTLEEKNVTATNE